MRVLFVWMLLASVAFADTEPTSAMRDAEGSCADEATNYQGEVNSLQEWIGTEPTQGMPGSGSGDLRTYHYHLWEGFVGANAYIDMAIARRDLAQAQNDVFWAWLSSPSTAGSPAPTPANSPDGDLWGRKELAYWLFNNSTNDAQRSKCIELFGELEDKYKSERQIQHQHFVNQQAEACLEASAYAEWESQQGQSGY